MPGGRFITFEGGEGAGKSTQVRLLAERLSGAGHRVLVLREPGGTPLGEALRHLLKHDPAGHGMAPETELLLMNASRSELVRQVIRPALDAGTVVLCDRFADSTRAYQGAGRGLSPEAVESVLHLAVGGTHPALTLWLRLPRELARLRVAHRGEAAAGTDRFEAEQEAFFQRVDAGYAALAEAAPHRWRVIDASPSAEAVAEAIWTAVQGHLMPGSEPAAR